MRKIKFHRVGQCVLAMRIDRENDHR